MFWFMVFVFDAWTGGEDGLTGINRLAVLGYAAPGPRALLLLRLRVVRGGDDRPLADRQLAVRPGHPGDPAERDARPRRRLRHGPVQVGGVHALVRVRRPGGGTLRARAVRGLRRADEPVSVGQRRPDVPDRRRVRQLLRPGARRRRLPRAARRAVDPDRSLDARLRRPVHGGHPVHAGGDPRGRPAAPAAGRVPRHGRGPGGPRARVLDARRRPGVPGEGEP